MTREELNLLVQRYLDGEADEAERERLLAMVERDAEAARLLREGRALQGALEEAGRAAEADDGFVGSVMVAVRRNKPEKVRLAKRRDTSRLRLVLGRAAVVAAAAVLALCVHNTYINDSDNNPNALLPDIKKAEAKGIDLKIIKAEGEVSVKLPDGQSDPLAKQEKLPQQASIATDSTSRAMFNLASAEVRLNNDSLVCYDSFEKDLLKLTLKEGQLNIDCDPAKGAGIMITTQLATITAYDAKFDLQAITCYEDILTDTDGNRYLPDPPEAFQVGLLKFAYDNRTGCLYASGINGNTWHLLYRKGFGYVKRAPGYFLNLNSGTGFPDTGLPNSRFNQPGYGIPQPGMNPHIPGAGGTSGPGLGAQTYYGSHMLMDSRSRQVGDWGYEGPAGATQPIYSQKGPTLQRKVLQLGITVSRGCVYVKYLGKEEETTMNAPRRMLITTYEPRDVGIIRSGPYVSQEEAEHANSWWENNQRFNPRQPAEIDKAKPQPRPMPKPSQPLEQYLRPESLTVELQAISAESGECVIVVSAKLADGRTFYQTYSLREGESLGWYESHKTDTGQSHVDMRTPYKIKQILRESETGKPNRVVIEMSGSKGIEIYMPQGSKLPCLPPDKVE